MKQILLVLAIIMSFSSVFSQNKSDANIFGHVLNAETGDHLSYINIQIKGSTIGTATDATGHYYLRNLPEGTYIIESSGLGYKTTRQEITIEPGVSKELNFFIEEDKIQLETVVVSASRNEVNRKEAPTIVNVLSPVILENTNSNNLAQGLNFQPGLRVENNCQNCGFQQVRINGLEGPYSQILIDSRPIFSSLAGVYGLEQIPANMIDRVEIVRGGGSAIFGSNAIAGTINIITKEAISNTISIANTTNLIGGRSADNFTSLNASLVSDTYNSGVIIFGSTRQQSPYDHDGDGFTEVSKNNAKNIGFRAYYRTQNYGKLSIEYHNINEFRRGGNELDLPPHYSDITEQVNHNINTGGVKYDLHSKNTKHLLNIFSSAQKIDRDSYYGTGKDPNAYGKTKDFTIISGFQYSYSMDKFLFMPTQLTIGNEYTQSKLNDKMLGYNREIDQQIHIESIFVQNEWRNEKISILLGGRLDNHNLIHNPIFSPRINIRYNPSSSISLRTSYSSGFRAPQAYDEDLHVTAVGGVVTLISLNPNLKTENSQSYSASVDLYRAFGKTETNILIEAFYTNLDNVFVLEEIGTDNQGNLLLERRNGTGAIIKGINLEGKLAPSNKFQVQLGFTIQKSEYVQALQWSINENLKPQKRMFRSPDKYGYFTAFYNITKNFSSAISGTYTGPMLVQHFQGYVSEDTEFETPNFIDLTIKFSYNLKINSNIIFQLNAGVQNILNSYQKDFDQGEYRDAGYMYGPSLPRTYFFGLKINI